MTVSTDIYCIYIYIIYLQKRIQKQNEHWKNIMETYLSGENLIIILPKETTIEYTIQTWDTKIVTTTPTAEYIDHFFITLFVDNTTGLFLFGHNQCHKITLSKNIYVLENKFFFPITFSDIGCKVQNNLPKAYEVLCDSKIPLPTPYFISKITRQKEDTDFPTWINFF